MVALLPPRFFPPSVVHPLSNGGRDFWWRKRCGDAPNAPTQKERHTCRHEQRNGSGQSPSVCSQPRPQSVWHGRDAIALGNCPQRRHEPLPSLRFCSAKFTSFHVSHKTQPLTFVQFAFHPRQQLSSHLLTSHRARLPSLHGRTPIFAKMAANCFSAEATRMRAVLSLMPNTSAISE